ncbi:MAG: peptidoglycan/LPS O-acetylase OafA/YrhL [Shewanella psychromarinicola]
MIDNRKMQIDTLRGIACILLVSYHVIGSTPMQGMKISTGLLREINDLFVYIRMPLFAFISGVLYGFRPIRSDYFVFIKKKTSRLLYPLLTVGTLFALLQYYIPGTNGGDIDLKFIHIIPVGHYWFLEAIFLVFCFVVLLEYYKAFDNFFISCFLILICISIYLYGVDVNYFSLSGFVYLLPFFLYGMMTTRYQSFSHKLYLLLLVVSFVFIFKIFIDFDGRAETIIVGFMSCIFLFLLKLRVRMLAYIGLYSFSIYLFHVFFTASSRIILNKTGFFDTEIIFLIGLVLGVSGPIVTDKIFSSNTHVKYFVLGK